MIMYNVKGKVALVTGGASGIGLATIKELLENEIKGVLLADINEEQGKEQVKKFNKDYGNGKVIFKKTDVSDKTSFEEAFKTVVETFKQLDIVVNNAGVARESMETYEKLIDVNVKGCVTGTVLAVENYLPKYRSEEESVVVNISSIAALRVYDAIPIYGGGKSFVVHFSRCMASESHYVRTKTKVLVICPGATRTSIFDKFQFLSLDYQALFQTDNLVYQTPEHLAQELVSVIKSGKSGTCWLVENSLPAAEVEIKQ